MNPNMKSDQHEHTNRKQSPNLNKLQIAEEPIKTEKKQLYPENVPSQEQQLPIFFVPMEPNAQSIRNPHWPKPQKGNNDPLIKESAEELNSQEILENEYRSIATKNLKLAQEISKLKDLDNDKDKCEQLLKENYQLNQNLKEVTFNQDNLINEYHRVIIEKMNVEQKLLMEMPNSHHLLRLEQEKQDIVLVNKDLTKQLQDLKSNLVPVDSAQINNIDLLEKIKLIEENENLKKEIKKLQYTLKESNEEKTKNFNTLIGVLENAHNELKKLKESNKLNKNP